MDEQVLHDAGYRLVIKRWLKPIGSSLLVYEPATRRWSLVYRDAHGAARLRTSVEREDEPLGPWLARTEDQHVLGEHDARGDFHFRTHQIEGSDG